MSVRQLVVATVGALACGVLPMPAGAAQAGGGDATAQRALVEKYCVTCHNDRAKRGNLSLAHVDLTTPGAQAEVWEKMVRKLSGGMMPPPGAPRPEKAAYDGLTTWLERELERAAVAHPNPGRTESFHRLNRAEYHNIVRDLFGLEMDFTDLLPVDDSGGGTASFDNIASSLRLTQSLMEQYLSVARKVSRTAVGSAPPPAELTFKVSAELPQNAHIDGLPFGTRGGLVVNHYFPVDAEYTLRVNVAGNGRGQIELSLDGTRVKVFDLVPKARGGNYDIDAPPPTEGSALEVRLPIKAGPRQLAVAFVKASGSVMVENDLQPFEGGRNGARMRGTAGDLGGLPGIDSLVVKGPLAVAGKGDTPSRRRIFVCQPTTAATEEGCAKTILGGLARQAYRRPVTEHDLTVLLALYKEGRAEGDFETGIERGVRGLLANPNFLFRVETDPVPAAPQQAYRVSDVELASRLSFFLWSSIPDAPLLDLAVQHRLHEPAVLAQQVRRMLQDPRAAALTENFAAQWLWVRNLKTAMPSEPIFPNFDEALRQAYQREMELFFGSIVAEDRSALDLLDADYTFVNERLAKQYGIPNVAGTDFRRVQLSADSPRRGLLGKGLILLVTSRSTRTSPVVRGKWILENLLGTPPPPPPPNVPALAEQKQNDGRVLTVRELMAKHRANPVCAGCHSTIDPAGFALEQFDAVGKWRTVDAGFQPIDASGTLPDGTAFAGINQFRALLLAKREQFVRTLTEKLLIYALGRGTAFYDGPAIRQIVREAAGSNYRFSALVGGIVKSVPFQMRTAPGPAPAGRVAAAQ